ncbi:MAG: protein translocase subunit SecD [Puniceicoccales bacterium]|jgi:SecD/SecF fusion protein|nr:protein translocase subunit SecD [Puniceicoccales bacterium]
MLHATKWRLVFSLSAIVWALLQSFPLSDRPFKDYLQAKVKAHAEEFNTLMQTAQSLVQAGEEKSLMAALLKLCAKDKIALCKFFPEFHLADIKNFDKRNRILLQHLFKNSQSVFKQGLDLKGGVAFSLEINPKVLLGKESWERQQLVQKAIEVIASRVDSLGVAEPIIRPRGDHAIEVQLPGISLETNPDVVQALKKPAKLEFRLVNDSLDPIQENLPLGYERLWLTQEDTASNEKQISIVVKRLPEMTGKSIKRAQPVIDSYGRHEISLQMTDSGKERFAKVTKNNLHKRLAIVLDGKIYSAPVIQSEITNGQASISGKFTQREALELSHVLNNPLEFELDLMEVYEVGPSLAKEAKSSAIQAALMGMLLVMALLIYYYRSFGIISSIALCFNGLLIIGAWASIGATITLPSITALAITFGMAVDANVLILERVREEMQAGKDCITAMELGHRKAFVTILDANLTTLLTAVLLIWLGVGAVKGFGVTLAIGIFTTLFSVLVFNRALMDIWVRKCRNFLPLRAWLSACSIHFLKYKYVAFALSFTLMMIGIIAAGIRGKKVLGIDFVGGDELLVKYVQAVDCQAIRSVAHRAGCGEIGAVYQKYMGKDLSLLKIQSEKDKGMTVLQVLNENFPEAKFQWVAQSTIGASVSVDVQKNAILSIFVALCGILLYVALRFEFGYGIGAVIALLHDTLITIGLYILIGHQFSAPMVAAVLMIIGYSINDTIIIFDRIREELGLNPSLSLGQVIDVSINKTLSRTLMTSLTTFMPAFILFVGCSGVVSDYALVFLLGIATGTFSSIFIASPILYIWHRGDRKRIEGKHDEVSVYTWVNN